MSLFSRLNKIIFAPAHKIIADLNTPPIPANQNIPEWYKRLPRYVNNSDKPIKTLGVRAVKTCAPFRDAMISGYFILLPADIEVIKDENGKQRIYWNPLLKLEIVEFRGGINNVDTQVYGMPSPIGCEEEAFAWKPFYAVKTEKPYSILVTHPLNRYELPFITTSGIIDSGYFSHAGNIPFFLKKDFEGIIKKGTPIAQVFPFLREDWQQEIGEDDSKENSKDMNYLQSFIGFHYNLHLRQKRSFN